MISEMQVRLRRARLATVRESIADAMASEASKGCDVNVSPLPVPVEPVYAPIGHTSGQEQNLPSLPTPMTIPVRLTVWLSPNQACRWIECEQFLRSLSGVNHRLAFEIAGNSAAIAFRLVVQESDLPRLRAAFRGFFEQCVLSDADPLADAWANAMENGVVDFAEYVPRMPYHRRITEPEELAVTPFKMFLGAISELPESAMGVYQVVFQPVNSEHAWRENIRCLHDLDYRIRTYGGVLPNQQTPQQMPSTALTVVSEELSHKVHGDRAMYAVVARLGLLGQCDDQDIHLMKMSTFVNSVQHGGLPLRPVPSDQFSEALSDSQITEMFQTGQTYRNGFLVNSAELASLVHLPPLKYIEDQRVPLVCLDSLTDVRRTMTDANELEDDSGTAIGTCYVLGDSSKFTIPNRHRGSHTHIMGIPGKGKSTLLIGMTMQDIQRGHGVAVLDPHGELIEDILDTIPPEEAHRVIHLHFDDPRWVPLWNPLEFSGEMDPGVVTGEIIRAFRGFMDGWGDRLEHLLRHAILGLLPVQGSSMGDLATLLHAKGEGAAKLIEQILEHCENDHTRRFWERDFGHYRPADLSPPQHKLSKFLSSGATGAMLSQPENRFSFRDAMEEGKILLVDLSNIGTDLSNAVGCLFLSLVYTAALGRGRRKKGHRRQFHVYVDEAHRFITNALGDIIDETRKFGVDLTLAHQRLKQFGIEDRNALSDCRTRMYFALSGEDAKQVSRMMCDRVGPEDLMDLGTGEVIACVDNETARIRTFPPTTIPSYGLGEAIIAESHEKYYRHDLSRKRRLSPIRANKNQLDNEFEYEEF